ncbi:thiol protease/hemagglutinin PrtT [Flavobacterium sp. SUN046]|uniref:thiol protease/hemagglutinin PrtT n=1 Tax=Flavobacterium sp. SUN046 TaxID=3002440 RepID=UPI002DBEBA3B|nr:thiol protease/hemagglutinin PrtT [Flavobacterium sp. SUN046]MEC4050228.1 thiol protease/hemagglutinin PrtT [Flavobacterium sp. SUN046]
MKTKLLALVLLVLSFYSFAKPVDVNRAKTVGLYFLKNKTNSTVLKSANSLELAYTITAKFGNSLEEQNLIYVFNIDTIGFVIVAADDTVIPILGYSDQGIFHSENVPPAFQKWMEGYKKQMLYVLSNDIKATDEINQQWSLDNVNKSVNTSLAPNNVVGPLIQTHWDQHPLYNNLCPYDSQYNDRTVTGCVATAMAQIIKYWNYPTTGNGFHMYNHPKYGALSANFGNTTYQWGQMPNQISSSSTSSQINAVATLMYHCGVSVNMEYALPESGAEGAIMVSPALNNYFGYSSTTISKRSTFTSDLQWTNLLKSELDAGRPMYYEGTGGGSGHAFVCDGYDSANMLFHFNWGWSGMNDSYFNVNALNPQGVGAGGGSGMYNDNQKIVRNIQPPTTPQNYILKLSNTLSPSSTIIAYGNPFTVTTNITNYGTNTFSGDYTVGAFDSNGNFIDYVETKINYGVLQGGYTYNNNIVFSTAGMFNLLPGTYSLQLYYRATGGGWKAVQNNGSYTNLATITIVNNNSIALNSAMIVSPSTSLTQGQSASVNVNIRNDGSTTFIGQYQMNLYNLDGSFVQTIYTYNENNGLPGGYTYNSPYLTFTSSAITASPGSYLLAVIHKSNTDSTWQLTGSNYFQNPITITVVQAPYQADIYENNDAFSQSYSLPLSFSGNTATVNTSGSNAHIGTDNDYYKIVLPAGYNYTITPRLHDSYSSNNGNTYSLDALFTYSTDGVNWSSVYDDVISGTITITNGGTIYFHVAPYFQGNTGTYLLDVNLSRTVTLNNSQQEVSNNFTIAPNPTTSKVYFDNQIYNFTEVSICNYLGQEISKRSFTSTENNQEIDLSHLATGVYLLRFSNTEQNKTMKIIKE